jgi:hypothetical protein
MGPWESVTANRRREGEAGGERGRLGWAVGRGSRREGSAVATEGAFDFARAGTRSTDDGLRTGEARPLERQSNPICLARAAIQPLILSQKSGRKTAIPASLSRE